MAMPRSQTIDFPCFGCFEWLRDHPADRKYLGVHSRNSESPVSYLGGSLDSLTAVAHGCNRASHDNFDFY